MKSVSERKRKSKGSLSVLGEFTGETGSISFVPNISHDVQVRIDAKTKLADAPVPAVPADQPADDRDKNLGQSSDNPKTEPRTNVSSSSRDFLIKEESTTTQTRAAISQIDLGLVQHLGITTSVLARCAELYPSLQPEQLEVLVFRFAEFAKDPKNKVQNARGFFISLAEQASKGQVFPARDVRLSFVRSPLNPEGVNDFKFKLDRFKSSR